MYITLFQAGAYIDTSTVTYAITALAAILISCGFAAGIIWRKLKHKVSTTLGIDENANKEVEEDIVIKADAPEEADKPQNGKDGE